MVANPLMVNLDPDTDQDRDTVANTSLNPHLKRFMCACDSYR